jgi:hypothetical protein
MSRSTGRFIPARAHCIVQDHAGLLSQKLERLFKKIIPYCHDQYKTFLEQIFRIFFRTIFHVEDLELLAGFAILL